MISWFNFVAIKSGRYILMSRAIEEPFDNEKSFFALIALGENLRWLSGRWQGG